MEIRVMSWNMAGAKMLGMLDPPPHAVTSRYVRAYRDVWENGIKHFLSIPPGQTNYPDIILLQECIGFIDARPDHHRSGRWSRGEDILKQIYSGYTCFFFPALSSHGNPHPGKWQRYKKGNINNYLPDYVEAQQGYGICVREDRALRKLWVTEENQETIPRGADEPGGEYHLCFEAINTTTGLYLGSRDTEPRLVIMGRMKVGSPAVDERYLNFLNIHLTTLKGERVGNIRLNRMASESRLRQLDLILDNVVSAYQEATTHRVPRVSGRRQEDVWVIGGDFNAASDSEEIALLKRMGFIDGNPDKALIDASMGSPYHNQIGTKWSLSNPVLPPTILDYIFCGLERTTFPTNGLVISNSFRPYRPLFSDPEFESDHAVLIAVFEI